MKGFCDGIKEHSRWKLWFKKSIEAGLHLNVDEIEDCHFCTLGKWIDSVVGELGKSPSFVEMCHSHKLFHITAGEVARKMNAGATTKAKLLMEPLGEYSFYSNKLISDLIRCQSEFHPSDGGLFCTIRSRTNCICSP